MKYPAIIFTAVIGLVAILAQNGSLPTSSVVAVYASYSAIVTALLFVAILAILVLLYIMFFSGGDAQRLSNIAGNATAQRKIYFSQTQQTTTLPASRSAKHRMLYSEGSNVEWLNVILARVMTKFVFSRWVGSSNTAEGGLRDQLMRQLNDQVDLPPILAYLDIRSFEIGNSMPVFHQIKTVELEDGGMEVEVHVEYEDAATKFDLATEVVIDVPYPGFARVPVQFCIEDIYFHAKLRLTFDKNMDKLDIAFVTKPEYDMLFSHSLGARGLKNLPKLSDLISRAIDIVLVQFVVYPHKVSLDLQKLIAPPAATTPAPVAKKHSATPTAAGPRREAAAASAVPAAATATSSAPASQSFRHRKLRTAAQQEEEDADSFAADAEDFNRRMLLRKTSGGR